MFAAIGLVFLIGVERIAADYTINGGGPHLIDYPITEPVTVDQGLQHQDDQTHVEVVPAGTLDDIKLYGQSSLTLAGGSIDTVNAYSQSSVLVTSGVCRRIYGWDDSDTQIQGGSVEIETATFENSTLSMSAGVVDHITLANSSSGTISGGVVDRDVWVFFTSQLVVSGGAISGEFRSGHNWDLPIPDALITFKGEEFAINGQDVPFGSMATNYAVPGSYQGTPCLTGQLTGTLADGSSLDNPFFIFGESEILFIPEPMTLALLTLGGLALRRRVKG